MSRIDFKQINKRFAPSLPLTINNVNLTIDQGDFCVFVGPSGCGKSTLLRMVAGLEAISSGDLEISGKRVNDLPPAKRGVAMVFQSYALYPHMTVAENMSFGLRVLGSDKAEIERKVKKAAEILQLVPLMDRLPKQLSGGQRQRVAIGRAIVKEPEVFLFDEPLSNLDAALRVQTRLEIAKLHHDIGHASMIYVTHDQVEAMTLADKIVVLRAGRIEQAGRPLELYNHPVNKFVAGFIGSPKMNFLSVSTLGVGSQGIRLELAGTQLVLPARAAVPPQPTLGVRPEHLLLDGDIAARGGIELATVHVELVEHLGHSTLVHARLADGQALTLAFEGQRNLQRNTALRVGVRAGDCHLFGTDDRLIG